MEELRWPAQAAAQADGDGAVQIEQGQGLVGREDRLEEGGQGRTGSVLEAEMDGGGVFLRRTAGSSRRG